MPLGGKTVPKRLRLQPDELLSKVVYGVAHPFGLLSGLLVFRRFEAVYKAGAADDLGQLFSPV
jgi:hypothetical protein